MWPAPTARVRRSRSCARFSKPPASARTSIPRPTWPGSTSASALARRRRQVRRGRRACRRAGRVRSQERRRADHRIRDRDGGGVSAVHAASGRFLLLEVGLGGRLDATNVVDEPLATVITPSRSTTRFPWRHDRADRGGEGRHPQARRSGRDRQPDARGAGGDRTASRAGEGAAVHRRRKLDGD